MNMLQMKKKKSDVKVIMERNGAVLPVYSTPGAAGADLHACLQDTVFIPPGNRALIPTGLRIELPEGYEAQIRSRSGLALKKGAIVLNQPGTIDSDYTGEIGVILINTSNENFYIAHGDRIAQMVIKKVEQFNFVESKDELKTTKRGAAGFGSTGV